MMTKPENQIRFLADCANLQDKWYKLRHSPAGMNKQQIIDLCNPLAQSYSLSDKQVLDIANSRVSLTQLLALSELVCGGNKPAVHPKCEAISQWPLCSDQYRRLSSAADLIANASGVTIKVQDTYYDVGQDWMWTTLIAHPNDGMSYQLLCPRDQKKILYDDAATFWDTCMELAEKLRTKENGRTPTPVKTKGDKTDA